MVSWVEKYKCPYCKNTYAQEFEARDCAEDCCPVEDPEFISVMVCDMCGESYINEENAAQCELDHERLNDLKYRAYLVKKNFDGLAKAANVPTQMRLGDIALKYWK